MIVFINTKINPYLFRKTVLIKKLIFDWNNFQKLYNEIYTELRFIIYLYIKYINKYINIQNIIFRKLYVFKYKHVFSYKHFSRL